MNSHYKGIYSDHNTFVLFLIKKSCDSLFHTTSQVVRVTKIGSYKPCYLIQGDFSGVNQVFFFSGLSHAASHVGNLCIQPKTTSVETVKPIH